MGTKENLLESIVMQLKQGLWEMENIYSKRIKILEIENENQIHQIHKLKEKISSLLENVETLKKVNLDLNNSRELLLKELNAKQERTTVIGIITVLLCEDEITNDDKVELIKQLLKLAVKEEQIEGYIKELMQIISDAFAFFDYYQKRVIKREIKKNYLFFHQLFITAQSHSVRKILFAYHSDKMKDMIKHLLDELIRSNRLYSYNDEDALNILLYIIYYNKIKEHQDNEQFQFFYNKDENYYAKRFYSLYKLYLYKKDRSCFYSMMKLFHEKELCIDLLKIEMAQSILKKFFKEEIGHHYNIGKKTQYMSLKDYRYRHPHYSELRNFGYQITNRTDEQRWAALLEFMKEYSLQATVNELHKRIRLKMGREEDQKRYANAIEKWSFDLRRLKEEYYQNDFPWPD